MAVTQLVGVGEIAEMLGVSRQRVHQIRDSAPDFPAPVGQLRAGYIWRKAAIERWARKHGRI